MSYQFEGHLPSTGTGAAQCPRQFPHTTLFLEGWLSKGGRLTNKMETWSKARRNVQSVQPTAYSRTAAVSLQTNTTRKCSMEGGMSLPWWEFNPADFSLPGSVAQPALDVDEALLQGFLRAGALAETAACFLSGIPGTRYQAYYTMSHEQ